MKKAILALGASGILGSFFLFGVQFVHAGWVDGYFRSDGTYVSGYYRTDSNYYKWDNYSWDGDWSDSINDKSWYRDFGYDPEPFDYDIPNYDYWDWNSYGHDSYDYDNYYTSWDDYDYSYDDYSYNSWYDYDYNWSW